MLSFSIFSLRNVVATDTYQPADYPEQVAVSQATQYGDKENL